ncbi:MAG: 1,4-alpha-glucan branching protein domain-containing protein [Candidatus Kapabacteria bacterium]|nr:1,4-alpha-glucan branching protein domain-containing protein [Candidatus Kapabacteria bacterium]
MHSGNYVLILHTHLPWVLHHGVAPHGVDWLNEAVAECYIPLLNVFNDLNGKGIKPNVTLDISPVLCEQLEHPDFKKEFVIYCDKMIAAARRDREDFTNWGYDAHHIWLTTYWEDWFSARKDEFLNKYDSSIIKGLKDLQDDNAIEIMTCGATHGYLPLLGYDKSVNLQIKAAVENYKKHFGREPRGCWLPECAYRPSYEWHTYIPVEPFHSKKLRTGVEQILAAHGIKYFVTDEDIIKRINPLGVFTDDEKQNFVSVNSDSYRHEMGNFDKSPLRIYNVSSSYKTEYGTAAVYSRHGDISMQVWSGEAGYPGEPDYLDFHKKHVNSWLRYWRVTDSKADMMYKTLYHPDWTYDKADKQAMHFIHHVENTSNHYHHLTGKLSTVCTPFDTELFGHWWFEGPQFIKAVLKGLHDSPYVHAVKASEQLMIVNPKEVVSIPEGSWGVNNNHDVWSNDENTWTWECIYNDELRLNNIFQKYPVDKLNPVQNRFALQALRELMLEQSSDWQFLIFTESARDYAEQRFTYHHSDFNRLCDMIEKYSDGSPILSDDKKYLEETGKRNSIFPELKLQWWDDLYK